MHHGPFGNKIPAIRSGTLAVRAGWPTLAIIGALAVASCCYRVVDTML